MFLKMTLRWARGVWCALCASMLLHSSLAAGDQPGRSANGAGDTAPASAQALYIAGLDDAGKGRTDQAYRDYAQNVAAMWAAYNQYFGQPMRAFARSEIPSVRGDTVFYPFSGPDFASVYQLFPDERRYVLVAIQNAGMPADLAAMKPEEKDRLLERLRAKWEKFARIGFFLTEDLDQDTAARGVPVNVTDTLMMFAARLDMTVTGVVPLAVRDDGRDVVELPPTRDASQWKSVRLHLLANGKPLILDYLHIDLSDENLSTHPSERMLIEQFARAPTLLKAASHLPQAPDFSIVTKAMLSTAPLIVQDETGIEYTQLQQQFNVRLYGSFTRAHHIFKSSAQQALARAYQLQTEIVPLTFRVGYEKQSGYDLQIAERSASPGNTEIGAIERRLQTQEQQYRALQRQRFVTLSDKAADVAPYLNSLESLLARPLMRAKEKLGAASMVVTIVIAADGSLRGVEVDRSSGNSALDQSIVRQFQQAVPLPAFPAALRQSTDMLSISLNLPRSL